jgi:hypothetical protein
MKIVKERITDSDWECHVYLSEELSYIEKIVDKIIAAKLELEKLKLCIK